jgi:hypothetical protein
MRAIRKVCKTIKSNKRRSEIMKSKFILVLTLGIGLALTVRAQVPGIINYQGRIVDGGTNFNGTGYFEFALISSGGTTNYWSNDGTAVGQPGFPVALSVTRGLYSVLLGDTTITHMTTAVPPAVFANSTVLLRVWFNDGVTGFQQLSPDQRIAAAGYAMQAQNAAVASVANSTSPSSLVQGSDLNIGSGNTVNGLYASVAGGQNNTAGGPDSFVGGGSNNNASQSYAMVGGGSDNNAGNAYATVGGGFDNAAYGGFSTVGGGVYNTAYDESATVGGGSSNQATNDNATVGGGGANAAGGYAALVGGGENNQALNYYAAVGGGYGNLASGYASFVGGGGYDGVYDYGYGNTASGVASTVAGGVNNTASGYGSFVGGGGGYEVSEGVPDGNSATGAESSVSGGLGNFAGGYAAAVGGGYNNVASGDQSAVGGGFGNNALNQFATVAGGFANQATGQGSFVGGGGILAGGGSSGNIASGATSTVGGGAGNQATNQYATVAGGYGNTAGGYASFAAGYQNTVNGNYSCALGQGGTANDHNAFLWCDGTRAGISQGADTFSVLATGGIYLFTGPNGLQVDSATSMYFGSLTRQMLNLYSTAYGIGVQNDDIYFRCDGSTTGTGYAWFRGGTHNNGSYNSGGGTTLMTLTASGLTVNGTFVSSSDRNAKQDFGSVDSLAVLDKVSKLPVQTWEYKEDPGTKHLGPMAQDFYAAFGVGPDDKHITTVDEGGVALAAIQGLNQKLGEKDGQIAELRRELAELKAQIQKVSEQMELSKAAPIPAANISNHGGL